MALLRSKYTLQVGELAPDFTLLGVDGKQHSLHDADGPVLIIFMCNHCPYVIPKFSRIKEIAETYKEELTVIGINSNNNDAFEADNFDNSVKTADAEGFNFRYLFDASQDVARAYDAQCTPDPFLLDKDHKIFYHGRLDDNVSTSDGCSVKEMEDVIEKMLAGEKSPEPRPSQGCSIKWNN